MRKLVFVLAVIGCDAYDRDLGPAPFLCGPTEPRCPMDYTCMTDGISGDEICVGKGGSVSTGLNCADDSAYEPNDKLTTATPTNIDTVKMFSLDGLAICPASDKDAFSINLSATSNVEVVVTFDPSSVALIGAILNQGGVTIATSTPVSGMAGTVHAVQQNLPPGQYYAVVSGPNTGTPAVNNYKLTITVN